MNDPFGTSDPSQLAELMRLGAGGAPVWRSDEAESLLRHQLLAPIVSDLGGDQVKGLAATAGTKTFADLFLHDDPPLELLRIASDHFKSLEDDPDAGLPAAVARVLWMTSVAAALVRHGARVADLDDGSLRRELQWVLSQPWVGDPARSVCREARDKLADRR